MSENQAEEENDYKKYSIRSEHALSVMASTYQYHEANLWIEGKLWEFIYLPVSSEFEAHGQLDLQIIKKHSSGDRKTAAEIIFWYWNDKKEVIILHQKVHDDFSLLNEETYHMPVNNKFNVVIRLLDKRNELDNNTVLDSYYGDFGKLGIEMVTLRICGTNGETEASFTVPKLDLMRASDVFHRMFTAEMTEKATGEVKIEDTNAEEFGDFLKAISPKQEYPNPSNVRTLLKLADRYRCQLLLNRCEAHLMNCIEIPLVERIDCAELYELKDLKENLLMHFEGTGIFELYRDTKPHLDLLHALKKLVE